MKRFLVTLPHFMTCALLLVACGDDDGTSPAAPTKKTSFEHSYGWNCSSGESCQDVFDVSLPGGATVTFTVSDVTGDSIVQLALYGSGEALGGTNLFTGTVAELRCNYVDGCSTKPDGQGMTYFNISAGTYRLAITRDWGESCGPSGTYRLTIHSSKAFVAPTQTVDDVATLASGTECP